MPINGKIGSFNFTGDRARTAGHEAFAVGVALLAAQGVLPAGLIVSKNGDGLVVPYEAVAAEALDAGDGAAKDFSGDLAKGPVLPGSVSVTDGVETFTDDGLGRLTGDAGGSGTVVYATGMLAVSFNAAPANEAPVVVDYQRAVFGVLDEEADTSAEDAGLVVVHGTVKQVALKVGATEPAAPSAALLGVLSAMGIYPV